MAPRGCGRSQITHSLTHARLSLDGNHGHAAAAAAADNDDDDDNNDDESCYHTTQMSITRQAKASYSC